MQYGTNTQQYILIQIMMVHGAQDILQYKRHLKYRKYKNIISMFITHCNHLDKANCFIIASYVSSYDKETVMKLLG